MDPRWLRLGCAGFGGLLVWCGEFLQGALGVSGSEGGVFNLCAGSFGPLDMRPDQDILRTMKTVRPDTFTTISPMSRFNPSTTSRLLPS